MNGSTNRMPLLLGALLLVVAGAAAVWYGLREKSGTVKPLTSDEQRKVAENAVKNFEPPAEKSPPVQASELGAASAAAKPAVRIAGVNDGDLAKVYAMGSESSVQASNRIPFEVVLSSDKHDGFEVVAGEITSGEGRVKLADLATMSTEKAKQISAFAEVAGKRIVLMDVGPGATFSVNTEESQDASGAPALLDSAGGRHEAAGFVYMDAYLAHIRFLPEKRLGSYNDLPPLVPTRGDQRMQLVFLCETGVEIVGYAIGETTIRRFLPVLKLEAPKE